MWPSQAAALVARRSIGTLARLWPSGMLEPKGVPQPARIIARVVVNVAGRDLVIPAANAQHLKRFCNLAQRRKEPHTRAWIEETLGPDDVFLDVGANVGAFSALAAVVAPESRIYAFEPELQSAAALAEMVAINHLPVTVYAVAIGARSGVGLFHLNGAVAAGYANHQLHRPIGQHGETFEPVASIGAVVMSIDDLVRLGAIDPPTHIKIDVDGQEDAVIEGASVALRSCRWLAVERLGDRARDFNDIAALGFQPNSEFTRGNMIIAQRTC